MDELMKKLEFLWGIPIFYAKSKDDPLKSFGIFVEEESPFVHDKALGKMLMEKSEKQKLPVLYKDENKVYFMCVRTENGFYLSGPVSTEEMDYVQIHRFNRQYNIPDVEKKHPLKNSLLRILAFAGFLYELNGGDPVDIARLSEVNQLSGEAMEMEKEDTLLEMRQFDDEAYHHTYQEERYVMNCVREGNTEAVKQKMGALWESAGILSSKKINHYRNLLITAVALATREAIEGGVSPAKAYRTSDIFINKIDKFTKIEEFVNYYGVCVCEFSNMVAEVKAKQKVSNYTEQCKDYIYKNYHHKIHLDEVAQAIGVSQGHLSRVFHADTGMSIQDYIQEFRVQRAANLLKYSEASLAEISDYVCFHSQSHFGSVFKKYMHMTPKQYRDKYKQNEFRTEHT